MYDTARPVVCSENSTIVRTSEPTMRGCSESHVRTFTMTKNAGTSTTSQHTRRQEACGAHLLDVVVKLLREHHQPRVADDEHVADLTKTHDKV